jgi:hypothetical protein
VTGKFHRRRNGLAVSDAWRVAGSAIRRAMTDDAKAEDVDSRSKSTTPASI